MIDAQSVPDPEVLAWYAADECVTWWKRSRRVIRPGQDFGASE
jgi:hypothetical protein